MRANEQLLAACHKRREIEKKSLLEQLHNSRWMFVAKKGDSNERVSNFPSNVNRIFNQKLKVKSIAEPSTLKWME